MILEDEHKRSFKFSKCRPKLETQCQCESGFLLVYRIIVLITMLNSVVINMSLGHWNQTFYQSNSGFVLTVVAVVCVIMAKMCKNLQSLTVYML